MIHLTDNGEIDFTKILESLEYINSRIRFLNIQKESYEVYFQANKAEIDYLCEIRDMFKNAQETINSVIPNSYEIIHANPMESDTFEFVGNVLAHNLENAFVNSQNGLVDSVAWNIRYSRVEDLKPARSTSVGDIIGIDGEYWKVQGIGFKKCDSPFPMNEI